MIKRVVNQEIIDKFRKFLMEEEKSKATIEKYLRDVNNLSSFLNGEELAKEKVIDYKQYLLDKDLAIRSVNSMIASINCLFVCMDWNDLKVKSIKVQKQIFCEEEKELSRKEYERLCQTAKNKNNERICLIMQTICSTGIRVSELEYITVEAVYKGKAEVALKGKIRIVFLSGNLQKKLRKYIKKHNIVEGSVFTTRNGKPVNRSNIWREMKELCEEAHVDRQKVYPHNLRHLFARLFYEIEKDIVKLADVLGHSSINTTRIYIISSGLEHRKCMEQMRLII